MERLVDIAFGMLVGMGILFGAGGTVIYVALALIVEGMPVLIVLPPAIAFLGCTTVIGVGIIWDAIKEVLI